MMANDLIIDQEREHSSSSLQPYDQVKHLSNPQEESFGEEEPLMLTDHSKLELDKHQIDDGLLVLAGDQQLQPSKVDHSQPGASPTSNLIQLPSTQPSAPSRKPYSRGKDRKARKESIASSTGPDGKKNGRWSMMEHVRFLEALKNFGKNWKKVEDYVATRTSTQARSHAQKFFANVTKQNMTMDQFLEKISHDALNQLRRIAQKSSDKIQNGGGEEDEMSEPEILNLLMMHMSKNHHDDELETFGDPEFKKRSTEDINSQSGTHEVDLQDADLRVRSQSLAIVTINNTSISMRKSSQMISSGTTNIGANLSSKRKRSAKVKTHQLEKEVTEEIKQEQKLSPQIQSPSAQLLNTTLVDSDKQNHQQDDLINQSNYQQQYSNNDVDQIQSDNLLTDQPHHNFEEINFGTETLKNQNEIDLNEPKSMFENNNLLTHEQEIFTPHTITRTQRRAQKISSQFISFQNDFEQTHTQHHQYGFSNAYADMHMNHQSSNNLEEEQNGVQLTLSAKPTIPSQTHNLGLELNFTPLNHSNSHLPFQHLAAVNNQSMIKNLMGDSFSRRQSRISQDLLAITGATGMIHNNQHHLSHNITNLMGGLGPMVCGRSREGSSFDFNDCFTSKDHHYLEDSAIGGTNNNHLNNSLCKTAAHAGYNSSLFRKQNNHQQPPAFQS